MSTSSSPNEHEHHADQRNAEIWSTRIQRELLALTTDNADAASIEEVRAMMPPFCKVLEHALDISAGTCQVAFQVEIVPRQQQQQQPPAPPSVEGAETETATTDSSTTTETSAAAPHWPAAPSKINDVVVTLDASLPRNSDGSVNGSAPAYPFLEPTAVLTKGQEAFPAGSTIQDGDRITMDLDWTPSLHLTDAILNLGLKIRESVLQKEPFHPAPPADQPDPVDEVAKSARRIASSITKGVSTNFSKAFSPRTLKQPPNSSLQKAAAKGRKKTPPTSPSQVRIGDEINMLEEPWVNAKGLYTCKVIRRPAFVQTKMDNARTATAGGEKDQESFRSPTAMFRSFAQSARSVIEECFLMITESHIIELKTSKLNTSMGHVVIAIPIDLMAKLKFKRQESLSLFFKPAPEDPLIYMCPDAGDAVHQIQSVLKRYGVKGKHTNAAAQRAISDAMQLVQEIQTKEMALKHDPTVQRVNAIMDLYRQAAERFEVAGDMRHEEVVTHMRKFLALPATISILDGSFDKPTEPLTPKSPARGGIVPEGEVLERTAAQLEDDDMDGDVDKEKEKKNDKEFELNMDNILKEAQEDLKEFKMDGDDTLETSENSGIADMAADLDAMMREADKELEELMSS
jgi:hypothetical protein